MGFWGQTVPDESSPTTTEALTEQNIWIHTGNSFQLWTIRDAMERGTWSKSSFIHSHLHVTYIAAMETWSPVKAYHSNHRLRMNVLKVKWNPSTVQHRDKLKRQSNFPQNHCKCQLLIIINSWNLGSNYAASLQKLDWNLQTEFFVRHCVWSFLVIYCDQVIG